MDEKQIKSGISSIDKYLLGLRPSDLMLITGTPGSGKTSMALQIVSNAARDNMNVLCFSLVDSWKQIVNRLLMMKTGINCEKWNENDMPDNVCDVLLKAINELKNQKLYIDDTIGLNVFDIWRKSKTFKRDEEIDLIMVDDLSLLHSFYTSDHDFYMAETDWLMKCLKQLAEETKCPVIVTANGWRHAIRQKINPEWLEIMEKTDMSLYLNMCNDDQRQGNGLPATVDILERSAYKGTEYLGWSEKHYCFS